MLDDATVHTGHGFVQSNLHYIPSIKGNTRHLISRGETLFSVLLLSERQVATSLFRFPCLKNGILLVHSENKRLADHKEIFFVRIA